MPPKTQTALITGASAGLGYEFAHLFARDKYNLVLVARSGPKLAQLAEKLRAEHGISVKTIPLDLGLPHAAQNLFDETQRAGLAIDILVNNAGYGYSGNFVDIPVEESYGQIQLNILALTLLTRLYLPPMIERESGRILNVASTAAFQAGPLMAVYYATKAYVLSFSEALANELDGTGVTVTALCPGPTRTEFGKAAGMLETRLFRSPLVKDARWVAEAGYRGTKRGRRVVIPGLGNWILAEAVRFTPRWLVTAVSRAVQESRRERR